MAVIVCQGPTCGEKRGSAALLKQLKKACREPELADHVTVDRETCFGECLRGPNVLVYPVPSEQAYARPDVVVGLRQPGAVMYTRVTSEDVEKIVESHLAGGQPVLHFTGRPPIKDE